MTVDDVFDALAHRHRRRLLLALHEDGQGGDGLRIPADVVRDDVDDGRLEVALFHRHLPKLADMDVVEWDREANVVSPGPRFAEVSPFLDLLEGEHGGPPRRG